MNREEFATAQNVLDLKVQKADREVELLHDSGELPGCSVRLVNAAQTDKEKVTLVRPAHRVPGSGVHTDLLAPAQTRVPFLNNLAVDLGLRILMVIAGKV